MARIDYDDQTAAAFQAVREIPRAGLEHWRAAVSRHLAPSPGLRLADVGAGTGAFSSAFRDWFGVEVVAVEPSASMRARIPAGVEVLAGDVGALPLPDASVDGVWLSLVIHHVPDLVAAAREIRRVLRPGAPVLFRQGFAGRVELARTFPWEFFPSIATVVNETYPSVAQVCAAFATAGFRQDALEPVSETLMSLAELLDRLDTFRRADTNIRGLTEAEFLRGKKLLHDAVRDGEEAPRDNWLDLLVLR